MNQVALCREWAKEMGFGSVDSNGARTKTHIHQMLQRYTAAKDLEQQSGAGAKRGIDHGNLDDGQDWGKDDVT